MGKSIVRRAVKSCFDSMRQIRIRMTMQLIRFRVRTTLYRIGVSSGKI
jgi:hypothetical protein